MCGIIGIVKKEDSIIPNSKVKSIVNNLLKVSESRGKDSSGVAVIIDDEIKVLKDSIPAHNLIKTSLYKNILDKLENKVALIGHARMETDGSHSLSYNNQPVIKDGCISVHNGIIVNNKDLWRKFKGIKQKYEVDTEVINSLFRHFLSEDKNPISAVRKALNLLEGAFSIGVLFTDLNYLLLATNTGSLYFIEDKKQSLFIFASEYRFVKTIQNKFLKNDNYKIYQLKPYNGLFINLATLKRFRFVMNSNIKEKFKKLDIVKRNIKQVGKQITYVPTDPTIKANIKNEKEVSKIIEDEYNNNLSKINKLKRCTKCLLPETMPFIEFDNEGVCNYCLNYQKSEVLGEEKLRYELSKYKLNKKRADCIVAFSGGRDSSYALHYVKNILKLNPVAFSYDWGMLTDLGRRNQARMIGKLGIEHILISADIQKKRENIRKNVLAWLKKPHLGTVPLFMAGDKQYFYYLNKLKRETGIDLVIYAANSLERTDFKYGFADVQTGSDRSMGYKQIYKAKALKLLLFYSKQLISNRAYINSSLLDSFGAYISSFFVPKDHLFLYNYIKWDEEVIESTLVKDYNWELASDTKDSWRIGDGTAAFYNYIYYTIAGFTENETFRSNQIREGLITRGNAMKLSRDGNKARLESLLWYANTIKINLMYAIKQINKAKKIY